MFNLFKYKEEVPDIFNHVAQEVNVGDVRKFRMPSDGCYNVSDPETGQWIFSVIQSFTVLTKGTDKCKCLVEFGYRTMEMNFVTGYLERGTLKL